MWLCSDPVTRLTIRQQAIEAGTTAASEARCALLSQRVTNLLLEAVPSAVKAEVVTVRALTPVGILFLLHTRYQPAASGSGRKGIHPSVLGGSRSPKGLKRSHSGTSSMDSVAGTGHRTAVVKS